MPKAKKSIGRTACMRFTQYSNITSGGGDHDRRVNDKPDPPIANFRMRIANHPSGYKSCFEPERMLNKPGLLVRRTACAELEWRVVKEFWFGNDKTYDAYGIDRRMRIG